MNPHTILEIENKHAHWRADQIAAIELTATTLYIIPVTQPERQIGFVYNKLIDAEHAYKKLLEDWRSALQGSLPKL